MTDEQKRLYDGNAAVAAQKKTGVKWLSDDIKKLAASSLSVTEQFAAYYIAVRACKRELDLNVKYSQPNKQDSKQLLELLDALNFSSSRKMGAVKTHTLQNVTSVSIVKKLAAEARKRKLKSEAAEEARIRKERAAAAAARQKVKIKLAADFLASSNFGGAIRACREAIEATPECARAHYLLFLADNNLTGEEAFRSGRNTHVYRYEEFDEAVNYADGDEAEQMMRDLAQRIKNFEEFKAYQEYMSVVSNWDGQDDYEEIKSQIYKSVMSDKYPVNVAAQYFDALISDMMPDDDSYIRYNVEFGDRILEDDPHAAEKYYANALGESDDEEASYKLFLAQSGVRSTAELLGKKGADISLMDERLFKRGCNDYAVNEICAQCLRSKGAALITAQPLFDYAISKIPKSRSKTAVSNLCSYTELLIAGGYFEQAKEHNELALSYNPDCHEAHFNRALISKQISNPLELVNCAATIFDDPDFYAATNAYALLNRSGNIYIDIGNALGRADKKLKDGKCRKYVLKNCKLKRSELSKCDTKIDSYIKDYEKEEAERRRREREREEEARRAAAARERAAAAALALKKGKKKASVKAFFLALPIMILGAVMLLIYFDPMAVMQFVHFGLVVGLTVPICLVMFIITCVFYNGGRYAHSLRAFKFRAFLTTAGYIVCFALMLAGVLQPKTVDIKNLRQLQAINNLRAETAYSYELRADIDLKDVKEFKPLHRVNENCTFNGNGHTVKNMKIRQKKFVSVSHTNYTNVAGFFYVSNGTVKNLTFEDCSVYLEKGTYTERRYLGLGIVCGNASKMYTSERAGRAENVKLVNCSVATYTKNSADGITMFGSNLSLIDCSVENCKLQDREYSLQK